MRAALRTVKRVNMDGRHVRRQECVVCAKVAYSAVGTAVRAAEKVSSFTGEVFHAYYNPQCGWNHIGHALPGPQRLNTLTRRDLETMKVWK